MNADWPTDLSGVTETVTTTRGPRGRWNAAALGVHAGSPVTARTWGRTRTMRNFHRDGEGYVQFVDDPLLFVEAALGIEQRDDPVLPEAAAWVRVSVAPTESGTTDGTDWVDWALQPEESAVVETSVPTIDRGFTAVVEATVAASRLDVAGYDRDRLEARLARLDRVVERAGDGRERTAFDRLVELSDW